VGVLIALEMALVLMTGFTPASPPQLSPEQLQMGNTKLLGIEMYTHYLYPLQVAAVLLLVAIVAAIALTLRRRKDSRYVNPADQIRVTKAQRLRVLRIDPVVDKPAAATAPGGEQPTTGGKA
jgi:NADH-quinone oxidoreductase subunit J